MNGDLNDEVLPRYSRSNGIDKERHIVIYHLNDGVVRFVAVFRGIRIEDAQQGLSLFSRSRQLEVRDGGLREDFWRASLEVFVRNVAEILP